MVTDGAHNMGGRPQRAARDLGVPVFAVGVGKEDPPKDLSMVAAVIDPLGYVGRDITISVAITNSINKGPYLLQTIFNDKNNTKNEAITEIYKILRPGEPPTIEIASQIFNNLFFSSDRYDLSDVGRVKMNSRLQLTCSDKITILRNDDIFAIIKKMLDLRDGKDEVDDIDHLANRRVRSVGELVENQFRIGILRMERVIKEKMSTLLEVESAMPQDLINPSCLLYTSPRPRDATL